MKSDIELLKEYSEAKSLPLGHVGRRHSREAVESVYSQSHELARVWTRRIPRKFRLVKGQEAFDFCNLLCEMLGERKIRCLVLNSEEVPDGAAAIYRRREIHFSGRYICLGTLLHELAHHFGVRSHGEEFCWHLDFLFRVAYTQLTGKDCHSDW